MTRDPVAYVDRFVMEFRLCGISNELLACHVTEYNVCMLIILICCHVVAIGYYGIDTFSQRSWMREAKRHGNAYILE